MKLVHTLSAILMCAMLSVAVSVRAEQPNSSSSCPGFAVADVSGLNDYHLTSCCYKGCGGACCRCGSASGYLSDCASSCGVGRTEELAKLKSVSLPNGLIVVGRLVHAQTKQPLPNESVKVVIPGGQTLVGKSGKDGKFRIELPGRSNSKTVPTEVGDLPFVRSSELEKDEAKEYQLFLVPKLPTKANS